VLFGAIILQLLIPALTILEYVGKRRVKKYWNSLFAHPSQA